MGSLSLTAPLVIEPEVEQDTPHDRRRLVRRGDLWAQQVWFGGLWQDVNLFHPQTAPFVDLEMGNWYSHTHPQAHFRNNLMVARATESGRVTLFNREFTIRHLDGAADKRLLKGHDELLAVLAVYFALRFPADTQFAAPGLVW